MKNELIKRIYILQDIFIYIDAGRIKLEIIYQTGLPGIGFIRSRLFAEHEVRMNRPSFFRYFKA